MSTGESRGGWSSPSHGFGRVRTRVVNKWCSSLETVAKKDESERMQSSGLGRKGEMDEEIWGSGCRDGGRVTVGAQKVDSRSRR